MAMTSFFSFTTGSCFASLKYVFTTTTIGNGCSVSQRQPMIEDTLVIRDIKKNSHQSLVRFVFWNQLRTVRNSYFVVGIQSE